MTISSKYFNFNSQRKEFFAEMSSLPKFRWEQVYNDSCDEGFTMVSKNTGDQVTFVVDRINTNADGDITEWVLIPTKPLSADRAVLPKNLHVVIAND